MRRGLAGSLHRLVNVMSHTLFIYTAFAFVAFDKLLQFVFVIICPIAIIA